MGRWRKAAEKVALSCRDGREEVSRPTRHICALRVTCGSVGGKESRRDSPCALFPTQFPSQLGVMLPWGDRGALPRDLIGNSCPSSTCDSCAGRRARHFARIPSPPPPGDLPPAFPRGRS